MTVGVLDGLHVAHDGLGEVGQVAPAEKRQRELPQTLGKPDAQTAALLVDDAVLIVVGEVLGDEQHDGEHGKSDGVRHDIGQCRAARQMIHERAHRQEERAHSREHHEVRYRSPDGSQLDVAHALIGESVLLFDGHLGHLLGRDLPIDGLLVVGPHAGVQAARHHELIVGALLGHASAVEHHDPVGIAHGG